MCVIPMYTLCLFRYTKYIFIGYYAVSASDFLFCAVDALLLLSSSPNQYIAKESLENLNSCLQDIDRINYIQAHGKHGNFSPFYMRKNVFEDLSVFDFGYYNQYPNPGHTIMYDAAKYIVNLHIEAK